ncbi:hypothetical protein WJX84_005778 [Apatococcus fuscideae]|uniref:RSE1/DDB1/CPSF1 second beta-propeller domain-containing protein n=1 Tax=Apatococcus fuscideae TaxID=2026836 RepID=A0AAW1T4L2_9CHLO
MGRAVALETLATRPVISSAGLANEGLSDKLLLLSDCGRIGILRFDASLCRFHAELHCSLGPSEDGSMIAAGSSCGWIAAAQLPLFQPNVIQKGPEARCLLKPHGLLLSLSVLGQATAQGAVCSHKLVAAFQQGNAPGPVLLQLDCIFGLSDTENHIQPIRQVILNDVGPSETWQILSVPGPSSGNIIVTKQALYLLDWQVCQEQATDNASAPAVHTAGGHAMTGTDEEGLKYPHGLYMHALNRETEEVLSTVRAAWIPNPKYRLRPTNAPKTVEMGRTLVVCCHGGQTRQIQTYIVAQDLKAELETDTIDHLPAELKLHHQVYCQGQAGDGMLVSLEPPAFKAAVTQEMTPTTSSAVPVGRLLCQPANFSSPYKILDMAYAFPEADRAQMIAAGKTRDGKGVLLGLHKGRVLREVYRSQEELPSPTGLWSLPLHLQDLHHSAVALSFMTSSRLLSAGEVMEDLSDAAGLEQGQPTIACGMVLDGIAAQVMPGSIRLCDLEVALSEPAGPAEGTTLHKQTDADMLQSSQDVQEAARPLDVWEPPGGATTSTAAVSKSLVLAFCSQPKVLYTLQAASRGHDHPQARGASLHQAAAFHLPSELSCVALIDCPSGGRSGLYLCALGSHQHSVQLASIQLSGGTAQMTTLHLLAGPADLSSPSALSLEFSSVGNPASIHLNNAQQDAASSFDGLLVDFAVKEERAAFYPTTLEQHTGMTGTPQPSAARRDKYGRLHAQQQLPVAESVLLAVQQEPSLLRVHVLVGVRTGLLIQFQCSLNPSSMGFSRLKVARHQMGEQPVRLVSVPPGLGCHAVAFGNAPALVTLRPRGARMDVSNLAVPSLTCAAPVWQAGSRHSEDEGSHSQFTLMCAGGGGLHIFELDQHERTNISRIAIASGLVPFKVQVNQRWGLLAVLMRPRSSDPSACYQLQVMQLQTSGVVGPIAAYTYAAGTIPNSLDQTVCAACHRDPSEQLKEQPGTRSKFIWEHLPQKEDANLDPSLCSRVESYQEEAGRAAGQPIILSGAVHLALIAHRRQPAPVTALASLPLSSFEPKNKAQELEFLVAIRGRIVVYMLRAHRMGPCASFHVVASRGITQACPTLAVQSTGEKLRQLGQDAGLGCLVGGADGRVSVMRLLTEEQYGLLAKLEEAMACHPATAPLSGWPPQALRRARRAAWQMQTNERSCSSPDAAPRPPYEGDGSMLDLDYLLQLLDLPDSLCREVLAGMPDNSQPHPSNLPLAPLLGQQHQSALSADGPSLILELLAALSNHMHLATS